MPVNRFISPHQMIFSHLPDSTETKKVPETDIIIFQTLCNPPL